MRETSTAAKVSNLIARARIVAFCSLSVAPKVHFHFFGAPTLY